MVAKETLGQLLCCERREVLFGLGGLATHSYEPAAYEPAASFSLCFAQPAGGWRDTHSQLQTYAVSN
jgi:hypothetical protein